MGIVSGILRGLKLYGAEGGIQLSLIHILTELLIQAVRERDPATFSPEDDLEYAAAVATELTCAILRLRTARREAACWWDHLPLIRRRYLSRA